MLHAAQSYRRTLAISLSAIALMGMVLVPHHHPITVKAWDASDESIVSDSDSDGSCLACQMFGESSIVSPPSPVAQPLAVIVTFHQPYRREIPRTIFLVRSSSSRAPPLLPA